MKIPVWVSVMLVSTGADTSNASDYTLFAGTVVGECLDCPKGSQ